MIAVAVVNIPFYSRIVRGTVLAVRETEYVQAARALGVSELRLSLTHVLRNCLAPVIVAITLNVGGMITALAGLSFLSHKTNFGTTESYNSGVFFGTDEDFTGVCITAGARF